MNIKKNDTVIVISGKEKGKKGKVIRVMPDKDRVVVEKINVSKRHQKPTRDFQGGIIEKPMPLNRSKVMLVCPRCGKPSKVIITVMEDKKRVRSCKKCKEIIDKE